MVIQLAKGSYNRLLFYKKIISGTIMGVFVYLIGLMSLSNEITKIILQVSCGGIMYIGLLVSMHDEIALYLVRLVQQKAKKIFAR